MYLVYRQSAPSSSKQRRARQPLSQETETPGESSGSAASCKLNACKSDTTRRVIKLSCLAVAEPCKGAKTIPKDMEYVIDPSGTSHAKNNLTLAQLKRKKQLYPNRAVTHYNHIKTNQSPDTPVGLPACFYCPITQDVMKDPVVLPDGHSFERLEIEEWVALHGTSPITRLQVTPEQIRPNKALKEAIEIESIDLLVQCRQSRWSRCTSFGSFVVLRQSRWPKTKHFTPSSMSPSADSRGLGAS